MLNVKQNSKYICTAIILLQIFILITDMFIYKQNRNKLNKGIALSYEQTSFLYKDLLQEYLHKKFHLLIEDMILILTVSNSKNDNTQATLEKCSSVFSKDDLFKMDINENNFFNYFYTNSNENGDSFIITHSRVAKVIKEIMKKYLNWKNKTYVNVEYMFEIWKDGNNKIKIISFPCIREDDESYYDKLYNELIKEEDNVIIKVTPSKKDYFYNICIKLENKFFCYAFNYYDLYIEEQNLKGVLEKQENMFYIVDSNLNVVYTPQYMVNEIKCNELDNYCTTTKLMYYLYKDILDNIDNLFQNEEITPNKYNEIMSDINVYYEQNIISNSNNIISNQQYNNDINNYTKYSFNIKTQIHFNTKTNKTEITNTNRINEIYIIYPLVKSFTISLPDYTLSYNDNKYIYYILIKYNTSLLTNKKKSLTITIISEFFLFLILLLFVDLLIWIICSVLHRYIIKGITLPLKHIRVLYLNLLKYTSLCMNSTSEHSLHSDLLKFEIKTKNNARLLNSTVNKCWNFFLNIRKHFYKTIAYIFQFEKFPEINKALTSLKAICIILQFNTNTPFEYTLIKKEFNYSYMQNIIEALEFLCEIFYNKYSDESKENLDYALIELITKNLFISMIQMVKRGKSVKIKESDIDLFYMKLKEAIKNARLDISRLNKCVNVNCVQEKTKNDLYYLNLMEEEFIYLYTVYKSNIFLDLLDKHLCEGEEYSSNIDEEEFANLKELQLKELHPRRMQNYGLSTNEQYRRLTVRKKSSTKLKEHIQNINNNKNPTFKNIQKKDKLNSLENTNNVEYIDDLSETTKQYITSLIENLEQYLKLKAKNSYDKATSKTLQNNSNSPIYRYIYNINSYHSFLYDDSPSYSNSFPNTSLSESKPRINILSELLKDISVYILLSQFYILCDNGEKCFLNYENALSKLKQLDNNIFTYKQFQQIPNIALSRRYPIKIEERKYKRTNFVLLLINTIVYENILFIFGMLSERFYQTKNELFINLNILDLSPLYSKSKRRLTLVKLLRQLIVFQKQLVMNTNKNILLYKQLLSDNNYIEIQTAIYKLQCIMNSVIDNRELHKNILFIFDLNNAFVRDNVFKEVLFHYFNLDYNIKNNNTERNSNNDNKMINHKLFSFNFTVFDNKLHIESIPNYESDVYKDKTFNKNYIVPFQQNEQNEIKSGNNEKHLLKRQMSNIKSVFEIIQQFKPSSNHKHRADKALYHSLIFGINEKETLRRLANSKNVKQANYIIMMTTLSSLFSDNKTNWKIMSELIYENKYSVIIILSHSPEIELMSDNDILKTIQNYKSFVQKYVLDGHLFIMRSLTFIKFILNAVFPLKFNEFNSDVIKHYIHSLKNISIKPNK